MTPEANTGCAAGEALRVDGGRLWDSLMEMARIGATSRGGVRRLALTEEDRAGRELFRSWCAQERCEVSVDRIGNLFARRQGRDPARPPVVIGSHLDSQPTGGRFDGAVGVLAGLEIIRRLNDLGIATQASLEVAVWTNEEGARFAPAMLGSGAFAGVFDLDDALGRTDAEGTSGAKRSTGSDTPEPSRSVHDPSPHTSSCTSSRGRFSSRNPLPLAW